MLHGRFRLYMNAEMFAHLFHVNLANLAGAFFSWTVSRRTFFGECTGLL